MRGGEFDLLKNLVQKNKRVRRHRKFFHGYRCPTQSWVRVKCNLNDSCPIRVHLSPQDHLATDWTYRCTRSLPSSIYLRAFSRAWITRSPPSRADSLPH